MTYPSDRRMGGRIERALYRVRSVFLEIPGVQLSLGEIARLTELETHLCKVLLSALEDLDFLQRREHGLYELQLPHMRRSSPGTTDSSR